MSKVWAEMCRASTRKIGPTTFETSNVLPDPSGETGPSVPRPVRPRTRPGLSTRRTYAASAGRVLCSLATSARARAVRLVRGRARQTRRPFADSGILLVGGRGTVAADGGAKKRRKHLGWHHDHDGQCVKKRLANICRRTATRHCDADRWRGPRNAPRRTGRILVFCVRRVSPRRTAQSAVFRDNDNNNNKRVRTRSSALSAVFTSRV